MEMIDTYISFTKKNGFFEMKRRKQSKYWMYESINEKLKDSFYQNPKIESLLESKELQVLNDQSSSFVAAKELLDIYFNSLKK